MWMRARIAIVVGVVCVAAACSPRRGEGRATATGTGSDSGSGSGSGSVTGSGSGSVTGSGSGSGSGSVTPTGTGAGTGTGTGVLVAERDGLGGTIRVEDRDGRRVLLIGDTLHAAVPWTAAGPDPAARDPLVGLLRLIRPEARTALVIGLGSGRTATELAEAGLAVTAVELDPAVIDVARAHFGFTGTAVAGDGLAYLRDHATTFDLVVMDAFGPGAKPPPELIADDALALVASRTAPGGVAAFRLLLAPSEPLVEELARGLRRGAMRFQHVLGGGVGDERQNVYVLSSGAALNWRDDAGLPLWPIFVDGEPAIARAGGAADPAATPRERTVTLVGYLHRTPDGTLALDLAHWEMGAARYVLANPPPALAAALPANARFPTQGDLSTDGDTAGTLAWLLGGGGVKRSDVRFSPVVAAITGTARLVSVIHPDASSGLPAGMRGDVTDDRLPWGGALYRLDVADVHWTLDAASGKRLAAAIDPALAAAGKRASAGDLPGVATRLAEATTAFSAQLGAQAALVPAHRRLAALAASITIELPKAQRGAFHLGAACDRMRERVERADPQGHLRALRHGFEDCAVTRYEQVAKTDAGADGYDAAARILYFTQSWRADLSSPATRKRVKIARTLQQKHQADLLSFPPGWVEGGGR